MRLLVSKFTLAVGCFIGVSLPMPLSADEPQTEMLKAKDVLDSMAKAYADCKTYSDSGVVKTEFIQATVNFTQVKPFATAFVRPDRFRFEYKETRKNGQESRYVICQDGDEVQTWWDVTKKLETPDSLGRALWGATGVSASSAHTIPALLLSKEVRGWQLTDIKEAQRIEDVKFNQTDCIRIQGKYGDDPMTIWIDKSTFLVLRIDSQMKFDTFRTETTTTYAPTINEQIADEKLKFGAPKPK